jgi:hypothetical protein
MAVQEHDAAEADPRQGRTQVLDQGHEGRDADVNEPREADVRIRQRVADRWGDDGSDSPGDPPSDLLGYQHVGEQWPVWPVLLGGARRHDHGVVVAQERLDLRARHLAEEHGGWLHGTSFGQGAHSRVGVVSV